MSNQKPLLKLNFKLTRPQIEEKRILAQAQGYDIKGSSGVFIFKGAEFHYDYDFQHENLGIYLMKQEGLSRFRSLDYIKEQLEKILEV